MPVFRLKPDLPNLLVILFVHLCTFGTVVLSHYAHRDDYIVMQFHSVNFDWLHSVYTMDGRLVMGLLNGLLFNQATSIDSLNSIRLVALLGGLMLAIELYFLLKEGKQEPWACLTGAIVGSTTLASVVYIGWTICFAISYAACLSLLSGWLFHRGLYQRNAGRLVLLIVSCLLYIIATMIYQGTSPMFLLPILFLSLQNHKNRLGRDVVAGVAVFFLFSFIYFLSFKAYSALLFESNPRSGRLLLEMDLPAIAANVQRLAGMTLNLNFANGFILLPFVTIIGFITFVRKWSNGYRQAALLASVILGCMFLGFLPALSSSNQISDFRTFPAAQVVICVTAVLGWCYLLLAALRRVSSLDARRAAYAIGILLAVTFACSSGIHLAWGIVGPSKAEHRLFKAYLSGNFDHPPRSAVFVLTPWHVPSLSGGIRKAEFGRVNANNKVNARWFMEYLIRETYPDEKGPFTQAFKFVKTEPDPAPVEVPVLDARKILNPGAALQLQ